MGDYHQLDMYAPLYVYTPVFACVSLPKVHVSVGSWRMEDPQEPLPHLYSLPHSTWRYAACPSRPDPTNSQALLGLKELPRCCDLLQRQPGGA